MENNLGRYQAFPESLGTSIELKSGSREASWGGTKEFLLQPACRSELSAQTVRDRLRVSSRSDDFSIRSVRIYLLVCTISK